MTDMSSAASTSSVSDIKYFLKFAINIPYNDIKRMLSSGSRLLYALKDCSRAGRVNWKLKLYRNQPNPDTSVAVYLKFEPQANTESVKCSTEFVIRVTGSQGKTIERQSSSMREFTKEDDCWGWSQFSKASELEELTTDIDGVPYLKLSGVIKIFETTKMLYPHRRHNFARAQNGADFKIKVGLATFHVHKAILALNSDYFASLFAHDCLETKSGQIILQEEKIQDVHLLLQSMYPGYCDVLEESTLLILSRQSAKYFAHNLQWLCMQYIDGHLGEALDADKAMKYYHVCLKFLQCEELAEQCIKTASHIPWSRIKETSYFKELDEGEKASFLQTYLDFKEERRRTPIPTASQCEEVMNRDNDKEVSDDDKTAS